jgi:hypothetical protein
MLPFILMLTALVGFISGLVVLGLGCYRHRPLQFGALVISSASSLLQILIFFACTFPAYAYTHAGTVDYMVYGIARNIAFTLFHIAIYQDGIRFRKPEPL